MSSGEQLYLLLVIATFGGFGLWLAYNTLRFDRRRRREGSAFFFEKKNQKTSIHLHPSRPGEPSANG